MTQYWFKPKMYGYGATPVTWQGWVVTLASVLAMVAVTVFLRLETKSFWGLLAILAFDVVAICFLTVVCRRKTEGEWRWRWGKDDTR
jgi:hypothetical protein